MRLLVGFRFRGKPLLPSLSLSLLVFFQYVKELSPLGTMNKDMGNKDGVLPLSSFSSFIQGMVENNGFEPLTPCVQGRCSSQLS